eukprot:SAG11_NODE_16603_length_543_cov_0.502252_1_plen_108_part_00
MHPHACQRHAAVVCMYACVIHSTLEPIGCKRVRFVQATKKKQSTAEVKVFVRAKAVKEDPAAKGKAAAGATWLATFSVDLIKRTHMTMVWRSTDERCRDSWYMGGAD